MLSRTMTVPPNRSQSAPRRPLDAFVHQDRYRFVTVFFIAAGARLHATDRRGIVAAVGAGKKARLRPRQLSGCFMSFEIERKFLVIGRDWKNLAVSKIHIRQAYIAAEGSLSVRARIKGDHAATLTIKSRGAGPRRLELEYPIPVTDAEALMARRRGSMIEKVRYDVPWQGLMWEVDVFTGDNEGLVLAEIELDHEHQPFDLPPWVGAEVTSQRKYYNGDLAHRPFRTWASSAVENVA